MNEWLSQKERGRKNALCVIFRSSSDLEGKEKERMVKVSG
jgi:hypothetical protein